MKKIRIRLLWHPQAQFAGYLVAQKLRLGEAHGIELCCESMRWDQDGICAVLSGDAEMAVASPSHLLESTNPQDLRFILAIQQESSLCYPVLANSDISRLSDLAGKTVGVWPGNEDLELRWMLHKAGLRDDAVQRLPMNETIHPFISGQVASAQMTVYHELHHLVDHIGEPALRLFNAKALNADLIKDGLIVQRDWLADNRATAQAAVDAILEGWTIAFQDCDLAIRICREFRDDMSAGDHTRQLADIRALSLSGATLDKGLGYPDPRHVYRAQQALRDVGISGAQVDVGILADTSLWQNAPASLREVKWVQS